MARIHGKTQALEAVRTKECLGPLFAEEHERGHRAAIRLQARFVERLQQTVLHEHWRVVFRRYYFTSRAALHRTLQRFMHVYNFERPHHGCRTRGRTPASIVFGVRAVAR